MCMGGADKNSPLQPQQTRLLPLPSLSPSPPFSSFPPLPVAFLTLPPLADGSSPVAPAFLVLLSPLFPFLPVRGALAPSCGVFPREARTERPKNRIFNDIPVSSPEKSHIGAAAP